MANYTKHPGPEQFPRQIVTVTQAGQDFIMTLQGPGDFLTILEESLIGADIHFAGIKLLGGSFGDLDYFTGIPDPAGIRIATYGPATSVSGPLVCLAGSAILGKNLDGGPTIHCHAVMADVDGKVIGGHINKGGCLIGAQGLRLHITSHGNAGFKVAYDAETTFDVFHPMTDLDRT